MQYAISVDGETPQIISINKDDKITNNSIWNKWVAENIIIKSSKHFILETRKTHIKILDGKPRCSITKIGP